MAELRPLCLGAGLLAAMGCAAEGDACVRNSDCAGSGICLASGSCAAFDPGCESQYRRPDGECVPESGVGTGEEGGGASTGPSSDSGTSSSGTTRGGDEVGSGDTSGVTTDAVTTTAADTGADSDGGTTGTEDTGTDDGTTGTGGVACGDDAQEPNDVFAEASPSPMPKAGPSEGVVCGADVDFFLVPRGLIGDIDAAPLTLTFEKGILIVATYDMSGAMISEDTINSSPSDIGAMGGGRMRAYGVSIAASPEMAGSVAYSLAAK